MIYIDEPRKYKFRGKTILSSHMISDSSIQELVGSNYQDFIYLGLTRAANSYILFVSSKRMIEERT